MLEIVYAENSEQFLWENNERFYLIQKTDFMNAVSKFKYTANMMCGEQILLRRNRFYQCRKTNSIIVKFKHRKHGFTKCFMRKQQTIF